VFIAACKKKLSYFFRYFVKNEKEKKILLKAEMNFALIFFPQQERKIVAKSHAEVFVFY
jgi:hypothetical protein